MTKDFLCVCAIFRNEGLTIREWVEHYRLRGVDRIHLIDDRSDDDYMSVIGPYLDSGFVVLHSSDDVTSDHGRQDRIYNKVLGPLLDSMEWLLLIDLDEFVWDAGGYNLGDYVREIDANGINADYVFMDDFGACGEERQPDYVVDTFVYRAERPPVVLPPFFTKPLLRASAVAHLSFIRPIVAGCQRQRAAPISGSRLRLNHYKLQSLERWNSVVVPRGSANAAEFTHRRHSPTYWKTHDARFSQVFDDGLKLQNEVHRDSPAT